MNRTLILVILSAAVMLPGCKSVFGLGDDSSQYTPVTFLENEPVKPLTRMNDRNNPKEVIDFARSLSKAGRYTESAEIYLDAIQRFKSKTGNFEIDCRTSAVCEYWLAGDLNKAQYELEQLENNQDIYYYSGETEAIRKLRKLLNDTVKARKADVNDSERT